MAEENILDSFKGATKNICNTVLNQVRTRSVAGQGPQDRLLEQGRRAGLRAEVFRPRESLS